MMSVWLGILMGVVMGTLSGLGVGGGKLLVPALVVFFGVGQHAAQGASLLAFGPIAIIAGYIHRRNGVVNTRAALLLSCGSVIGAGLGAWTARYVGNDLLQKAYGAFLILVAVYELINRKGTGRER